MKRNYYLEIILLLALSIAAASLAADHHFYELIWEKFGIDKQSIDISVAWIRIIGFFAIIVFSSLNIWKHLHSERRIVESLLAAVHKVVFQNINLTDSTSDRIHRITCHKYYPFSLKKTIVGYCLYILAILLTGLFLTHDTSLPSTKFLLWVFAFCVITIVFLIFLKVIDAWWYQFWLRVYKIGWRRTKWNRLLCPGKNYCLSYVRYGYESGTLNRENTTIPFLIDKATRSSRLFTGEVYDSDEEFVISKDHNGINELLKKLNEARKQDQDNYKADNDSFRTLLSHPVGVNVNRLCLLPSFSGSLNAGERDRVVRFMETTKTLAYDLFDINNIRHCEHFLGFKIQGIDDNSFWGVVVIDVLANSTQNFYEYLGFEEDERWLEIFLSSYSRLFSEAINPSINE